ncbi:MAG: hypothetical protein LUG45_03070 [Clostridiales bacterium]|nr:hypothetical protein [Clostridiales bacterium]
MANSVKDLLNQLYQMIDDAKSSFNGSCKIDRDKALDILDEVRNKFPVEVEQARKIVATRTEYLNQAQSEAEKVLRQAQEESARILRQAEEESNRMVDQSEVQVRINAKVNEVLRDTEKRTKEMVRQAQERGQEIAAQTEKQTAEVKTATNTYCDDSLRHSEEALTQALAEIRQARVRFSQISGAGAQAQPPKKVPYDAEKDEA